MGFSSPTSLRGPAGASFLVGTAEPPSNAGFGQDGDSYLRTTTRSIYKNSSGNWSVFAQAYNLILTGSAVPGPAFGQPADLYVRIDGAGITTLWQKTNGSWSQIAQLTGAAGSNATLPNDFTANSLAIAPVSGDSTPVSLSLSNASTKLFNVDASGNALIGGTLTASGASSLAALTTSGAAQLASLSVSGSSSLAALTASNISASGTLSATGNTTLQNLVVNGTSQFASVSTGNVTGTGLQINGPGSITGATSTGALTAASLTTSGSSNLAAVSATNISASGTLQASGATTLAATSVSTLTASGTSSLAAVTAANLSCSNFSASGTLQAAGAATLASTTASSLTVTGSTTLAAVSAGAITCTSVSNSGSTTIAGSINAAAANLTVPANNPAAPLVIKANGGASLLQVDTSGNVSFAGTLSVTAATTLASLTATLANITSNATVGGTLGVTGTSTLAALNATNASFSGTLAAQGATTLASLSATNATLSGMLGVTGASSVANLTSTGTVQAKNVTLTSNGGGQLTFADGTTQLTAATANTVYALGSNAVTQGPACQLVGVTVSSTPTEMQTQGVTISQPFYPSAASALMGCYLVTGSNSVQGTFELYDTTASKSIYTATVAANSTGGLALQSSTTYPMTSGNRHVWRVTGSGSFTGYVQPYYLTVADTTYGDTALTPAQISGTALSTSTGTTMFQPGGTAGNALYAAFRHPKPAFVRQVVITVVGAGATFTAFRVLQSGTSTVIYSATPSISGTATGATAVVGPYQAYNTPTTFTANQGYYCQVLGTGSPTINVQMNVVG